MFGKLADSMRKNAQFIFNLNGGFNEDKGLYNQTQEQIDNYGTGIYVMYSGNPTTPILLDWGTLVCFAGVYVTMQIFIAPTTILYARVKNTSGWAEWKKITTTAL